jgi:uncharacterized protein YsxB (DUF464 family)
MIDARIYEESIVITGHAGAGPVGHDLVCCAVSTLVHTLIISLEELTEATVYSDIREGYASIGIPPETRSQTAQTLIDGFICGLEALADSYPENISFSDLRET